ncbi:hypothetical protein HKD37_11G032129 [Glycine soja]
MVVESPTVATYPSAGGRRETRGMRVPRKEYARSRHQRLFEENIGKTGKDVIYELLSERFGSCIYARGSKIGEVVAAQLAQASQVASSRSNSLLEEYSGGPKWAWVLFAPPFLLSPLGPSRIFLQKAVASGGSNLARLGELGGNHLPYFAINRGGIPTAAICSSKGMIPLETIKRDMTTLGIITKSLRFYQVKVKSLDTTSIKELGRLMEPLQMQAFRKTYGKILELTIAEVSIEAIVSLTQYYDQPLRCFTFGDFQLVPTIEEFEEILGCPLGGRKPYLSSGCLPSLSRIATVVKDSARGLDRIKQTRNGIAGLPQRYLEDKARGMANQGDWVPFMDVLALLIFGVVLFPNVDGLVDLAAIDAFLAYHHSKESPVVAVLADLLDTFDRRCEKSSARIICCLPALCVWLVSHLFRQDTRHPCPLLSHRSCTEKRRIDWDQLLAGIGGRTISWFPRWKEGKEGVLFSCGGYPNILLVGTRGCINYNPALAIRQLGYPMRGAPTEESMSPFLVRDLGAQSSKTIQRIHKAWETPLRKDQELRGIRNGIIGGYHEWLKVHIRGLDWLAKLKVVSEESFEAPEEDEEELVACSRSKRSLSQRLCETETNMLAIIAKYQEELADMSALKEQMASMMEAMLSMKQLIEKNAATAAAVSSAAEADPTLLATTHHPPSNIVGRGRDTLGHDGSPHLGYNRAAYPYGLPPNYSPPVLQEDAGHIASPVHEREPPQQPDEVHKDPQDYARRDVEFYPPIPEGPAPGTLPQPNITASPIVLSMEGFADLVFAGERIEVGLKRGKFDYVSSTNANAKRIGATGAKRKEGDAHAVSSTPAWVKPQQTPHGTHQYAQHHPSFSAHTGNTSSSTPVQPKPPTQREAPQVPTSNTTRPAGNSNTTRNFPPRPFPEFTPLPMTYEDLLPSLIANHLAVVTPRRVLEPPFPKWYDPNATCKYHGGVPGHSVEKCLALKYKVQHLMDAGWLTFQEDRPNVRTNPLANHGEQSHRSKPLRDVATPRRFIFEALQKGGVISHSGCKEDSCLLHSGEMHDMETCLEVEELLQRMIDQGRLEVGIEGKEEQHICMQSTEGSGVVKPKPLVIYFTKSAASQKPGHPLIAKPVPFPYQNSHAVPWRYTPPGEKEEEVTDVSSLSAKVTNITGLSGVTRSGRVFAPPDLPVQPADVKGKGKVVEEQDGEAPHASNKEIPAKGPPEKKEGRKEVSLEEASEFLRIIQVTYELRASSGSASKSSERGSPVMMARVMLGNGYEPGMSLGKNNGGITSLINTQGNRGKYGLGYKPTQADMKRSIAGRKNSGQSSRWRQESEGSPPCHISRSFISAGLGDKGQAFAICEDNIPSTLDLVRPCPPDFQLGNWRVEERPSIYATSIISDDESPEGTNTWDPPIDFEREMNQTEDEGNEDEMAPRKLASKRSRKDKAAEGTSSAPEDDEYTDFQEEIGRRRWASLVTPMAKFDPEIVLEFYANAWPTEEGVRDMRSWVRGQWIPFDADAIGQLLGYPEASANHAHQHDHPDPDMDDVTPQQRMAPTRHPLDPDKSNRALGFPALITGLCQSFGVPVAPTKVIRPPITRAFIEKYCTQRRAQAKACLHFSGENTETFSSLTGYPELRRSEFLIGGYVGARASLLSTIPPFVAMTQELVARGDTLRLSAPRHSVTPSVIDEQRPIWSSAPFPEMSAFSDGDFSSLTSYQELRRSEFLIGGYAAGSMIRGDTLRLSAPFCHPEAAGPMTSRDQVWSFCTLVSSRGGGPDDKQRPKAAGPMIRGDNLRLSAPFCHLEAAGPMTSRDQIWSFYTLVSSRGGGPDDTRRYLTVIRTLLSSRGGGPDDTRRYLTVIRTLLSSRGGGPDDKQRPKAAGPMIRGDTLRLSAPFCHPEAAGPMTSRDQVWSFCTLVSSRGGGPDDTRRYLTVIRILLSSRGDGPDDKQRPSPLGPSRIFLQKAVASGGSNLARLGELGGNHLPYFAINRGGSEEGRAEALSKRFRNVFREEFREGFDHSSTFFIRSSSFFDLQRWSRQLSQRALRGRARTRLTGALSKGGKMRGVATNVYSWKTSEKPKETGQIENSKSTKAGLLLLRTLLWRGNQTYVVLHMRESSDSFYLKDRKRAELEEEAILRAWDEILSDCEETSLLLVFLQSFIFSSLCCKGPRYGELNPQLVLPMGYLIVLAKECVATYPSAGGRRVTCRMRVPRKEYARSRHQRLFEENVGKTGKDVIYELLGSGVVFMHGEGISTPHIRPKGRQPLIECANMTLIFTFPFYKIGGEACHPTRPGEQGCFLQKQQPSGGIFWRAQVGLVAICTPIFTKYTPLAFLVIVFS